jgi:hypothetical protein
MQHPSLQYQAERILLVDSETPFSMATIVRKYATQTLPF